MLGEVQSGKTSNYIGLMCKCADVGYRVIVLITSNIESLRRQTQLRVDEGFVGYNTGLDSAQKEYIGVCQNNPDRKV